MRFVRRAWGAGVLGAAAAGPALAYGCSDPIGTLVPVEAGQDARPEDAGSERPPRRDGAGEAAPEPGRAHLSAAGLDLGYSECGRPTTRAAVLTIENVGGSPLAYTAALEGGGLMSLEGAEDGEVAPGTTATVTIVSAPVPALAQAGVAERAKLVVTTTDPHLPRAELPVRLTPAGGVLAAPATALGAVPFGEQGPDVPIALVNAGNLAVDVALSQPADAQFSLVWTGAPAAVRVEPGASVPGLAARLRPNSAGPLSTTAAIAVTGAVCGSAGDLTLTGQATVGSVGVSPAEIFFGAGGFVSCGTQAAAGSVVVSVTGPGAIPFTASLGLGGASPYAIAPASGTITSAAPATITVTPQPVPATSLTTPDLYADALTLAFPGTGLAEKVVPLHQTARGARLSFDAIAIPFGDVTLGATSARPLRLTNAGNAAAAIQWTLGNAHFGVAPPGPIAAPQGGFINATVTFAPGADLGPQNDTLAVTTSGVLCAPLPSGVALSGNGVP